MTDEKIRAVLEEMRAFEKAHRLQGEGGNRSATEMADRLKRWGDTFEAALTVPESEAAIARVRALHKQDAVLADYCEECSDFGTDQYPPGQMVEWPCSTLQALGPLPVGGETDG